jgi:hypothetical protein
MQPVLVALPLLLLVASLLPVALGFDCSFSETYPRQYIAYVTDKPLVIDGRLDDPAWQEVAFSEDFVGMH